jgi:N,N'-diacetyllegionaminate synthase
VSRVKIIAEVGANHNGDMSLAKEMISAAAESGADYVKFQSWQTSKISSDLYNSPDPFFQFKNVRDFFKKTELSNKNHFELMEYCNSSGVKFLTTCFDIGRVDFLSTLDMDTIKIASCDSTSTGMIDNLSKNFKRVIASTGMTSMQEIVSLKSQLELVSSEYVLMHCVSMYPTPLEKISTERLIAIRNIAGEKGVLGISDHSMGTTFPKVAVTLGARWIEKHFTTDRNIPGPDNPMSIIPSELAEIRKFCDEYDKIGTESSADPYEDEINLRNVIVNRFGDNS